MRTTIIILSWLMLPTVTLQTHAADASANLRANIANGQSIYNEGKDNATACSSCHGEKALGMDDMESPRMANIGQVYIIKQLNDYAAKMRIDPGAGAVMNDIAQAMSNQDRLDVAAYLDSLEYVAEPSDLNALAASGIKIGNPKKGKLIMVQGIKPLVPACQNCHGISGRAANIGAIHQQKYIYLVNQMKRYRDGNRKNDKVVNKNGIMRGISKPLTDENIADIAAYLSTVNSKAR